MSASQEQINLITSLVSQKESELTALKAIAEIALAGFESDSARIESHAVSVADEIATLRAEVVAKDALIEELQAVDKV